jgi:hypothetical protein
MMVASTVRLVQDIRHFAEQFGHGIWLREDLKSL